MEEAEVEDGIEAAVVVVEGLVALEAGWYDAIANLRCAHGRQCVRLVDALERVSAGGDALCTGPHNLPLRVP